MLLFLTILFTFTEVSGKRVNSFSPAAKCQHSLNSATSSKGYKRLLSKGEKVIVSDNIHFLIFGVIS